MSRGTLHLIRHGESTWNAAGRWQGQADPPLSEHGQSQAHELAASFAGSSVACIVTSDLERARATAEAIGARCGIRPEVDPRLRELDVGTWSGRTRAEIATEFGAAALDRYFAGEVGWEGGEDYVAHTARCEQAAELLAERVREHEGATVVAVTHGGTIRGIMLALLELPPGSRWRFTGIPHGSAASLVRVAPGWRLASYGAPPRPHAP